MKAFLYALCILFSANEVFGKYNISTKILRQYVNQILELTANKTECIKQLKIVASNLDKMETWAFQMFDSSAKIGPGLLTGHTMFVGNYDECLEINIQRNSNQIKGQYCTVIISPSTTVSECINQQFSKKGIHGLGKTPLSDLTQLMALNFDICVPAVCTSSDLQEIWDLTEDYYELKMHITFDEGLCNTIEKKRKFYLIDIIATTVFGIIGALVLSSTMYDIFIFQKKKDKEFDFFMVFSLYTNGKRLISLKSSKKDKITCLNGIRVITLAWIILGHRTLFNYAGMAINSTYSIEWFKDESNMFITGSFACVDSFFVMSGLLITYIIMLAKEQGIQFNLIAFYIHRILRLSPSLAAMILLYAGILRHLGSGPYWKIAEQLLIKNCYENWWPTLLFVNNYVRSSLLETCIVQTWYLSADTQLYILSPLLFIPLQKWPKATITFIVGLIVASTAVAIQAFLYYDLNDKSLPAMNRFGTYVYMPTHLRVAPWLIGILFGFFMFKTKDKKIKIKKIYVLLLWAICLATMLVISYSWIAMLKRKLPDVIVAMLSSLSRPVWGICICWIIFACCKGYGGYINTFLSLSVFDLLARLTFSIFLSHLLVMFLVETQRGAPPYLSNLTTFHKVWGDYAFTLGFSVIWTLIFESPVTILETVLIRKALNKKRKGNSILGITT